MQKFMSLFNKDAKIVYNSMKELSIPKSQLYIHDDEPCPCGSGKLFLVCCKNKSDSGPVNSPKPVDVILSEHMRAYKKRFKFCLYPNQAMCKGNIKEAHALQNNKIISMLSGSDNHVIMQNHTKQPIILDDNPSIPIIIIPFDRVSRNRATTQSCFCDLHDTELFKAIEAGAPDFNSNDEKMKFVYAYKAFIFEYAKQIKLMSIWKESFAKRPQVFSLPDLVKEYRIQCMRVNELEPVKRHFDSEILSGTHNGIKTCVVTIPYRISFANYAYIAPDFDLNGEKIKNIDKEGKMHRLAITVFPEDNQSYILLSCLSSDEGIYSKFFEQITATHIEKILYYFNLILPLFSENIVLSKELWNAHSDKGQAGLTHLANLTGNDHFNMSQTFGMVLRNAKKDKRMDYSKRGEVDLFQLI